MMLIIADKSPDKAVDWLVENTNKNFCFKQLLELGQLICSAGISDVFKPIKQGKELQKWIKENNGWTYTFMRSLYIWVTENIKIKDNTHIKLNEILWDFYDFVNQYKDDIPQTAIWRYSKEYSSEYPTNSELPIEVVCELYKKYLLEFKGFGKKEVC